MYAEALQELQKNFNNREVSCYWINEEAARNCINAIRRAMKKDKTKRRKQAKSSKDLVLDDNCKFITVNNQKEEFLQYDNNNKDGNRLIIFFSTTSMEIMRDSDNWHIDGTFKTCPKIFYQLVTIQCVIKTQILPTVYALMERKNKDAYMTLLTQVKSICQEKGKIKL
jgi:hypothetical protein